MFYNRPYTLVEIIWTAIKAKRKHNKFVINAIKFDGIGYVQGVL